MTNEAFGFDKQASLNFDAKFSNGNDLPSWISFDSTTGTFEILTPDKITKLTELVVTATDSEGNVKTIVITLMPPEAESPDNENGEGDDEQNNEQSKLEKKLVIANMTQGKTGLTEQLNLVGSKGFEQQRLKLLDSIVVVADENDAA